ncbi:MAG: hypothetical protein JSS57_04945 [Proteobacteria bacterium]|nr:hypothetical protein [Pseudomonadota bacterium]
MKKKPRILIIGSCVTRDIFDQAAFKYFDLVRYVARSSLAPASSADCRGVVSIPPEKLTPALQHRMVEMDMQHDLVSLLEADQYDYLIYDAIDERFDVFIDDRGARCTLSNEVLATGFDPTTCRGSVVHTALEQHLEMWRQAWSSFIALLRKTGKLHRLMINQVFGAEHCVDGSDFLPTYPQDGIRIANEYLRAIYAHMASDLSHVQFLNFESTYFVGDDGHRRGKNPFHFVASYYQVALERILSSAVLNNSTVILERLGEKWHAELLPCLEDESDGDEYAFYLLINGRKVDTKWYSASRSVEFESKRKGLYSATGFVRNKSEFETTRIYGSNKIGFNEGPFYDINQFNWSVFERNLGSEFLEARNGIFHFSDGRRHLDILINGIERLNKKGVALVVFGGAVSDREFFAAPYFYGLGLAEQLQLPLVSISDPTLSLSDSIKLGWYLGHEGFPDLPKTIAYILDNFSDTFSVRLLICGGSGGGFASLRVSTHLETENASLFVWNPQTSVEHYVKQFVDEYIKTAFPNAMAEGSIASRLSAIGVDYDLSINSDRFKHQILYLQNHDDWHAEAHARDFLRAMDCDQRKGANVLANGSGLAYCLSNFGVGHVPPPHKLTAHALSGLAEGKSSLEIALEIDKMVEFN